MNTETLDLLQSLIQTRPVTSDLPAVNKAASILRGWLTDRGIPCVTENVGGRDVICASTGSMKRPDILFNAHIDVVPADSEQFVPSVRDGRLYARGASDCLGCAVCIASVLADLKGKASCGAIFSADEEVGGETTAEMVKRGYSAKNAVIVVDADYKNIAIAEKGVLILELSAEEPHGGGHSSAPWRFENPIDRLIDGYLRLRQQWKNPVESDQWHDSMTPCICKAGTVGNQIPASASMTINIRFISDAEMDSIPERVREITGLHVRVVESFLPFITSPDAPEISRLRKIMQRHFGTDDVPFIRMNGATDARHFYASGIPVAMIGLDGYGIHAQGEYLNLESFDMMRNILLDYAGGKHA